MLRTTHLLNQVTAEVSRSANNGVAPHVAAQRVLDAVEAHDACRYCQPAAALQESLDRD